jgi:protein SCO1
MKSNRVMGTVVVLLACMGLMLGLFVAQFMHRTHPSDMTHFHGTWLDTPREMSSFNLMGTANTPFNNTSLKHHWTMMFFGFTQCPSICPTTMVELAKMYQLLEHKGVQQLPQVVFVSLDPDRDSLDKLTQYVTAFNPHFYGARSQTEAEVKAMARELGVAYAKVALANQAEKQKNYVIEHTGTVMLFNPEGQLSAFFTMPHKAEELAEDYQLAIG